jgi:hypothetical protein
MKHSTLLTTTAGLLAGTAFLTAFTGCDTDDTSRRGRYRNHDRANVHGQATVVVYEDDYDYYPGYEVYYSRNRREYVYRDGSQWVRRPEPSGVSLNVLLATPSVRVDFRDSPERHHDTVVRSYPRNWKRQDDRKDDKDDRKDGRR